MKWPVGTKLYIIYAEARQRDPVEPKSTSQQGDKDMTKAKRLIAIAFVLATLAPSVGTFTFCGKPFVIGRTTIGCPIW